ncbi:MAG: Fe-S cluster assembly ATPase SufC [Lachnospiraceae bacterium]|nr:Fe-S cluster assembly ATPase SufC [Lachnospiraceae bacterium]MEE3356876.1 Fe-S cluster assembly ATPase SufC [Lachnospiraceae bacterium]
MAEQLLNVQNLVVSVADEDKEILHGVNLTINRGETHVLMGPNGAGKSTLGSTLMGDPRYKINDGKISFEGQDITELSADKISKLGMFISFQNPVEIPGITLSNFIRTSIENKTGEHIRLWDFKKELTKTMEILNMDPSYADRDLNVGFSGGEKKKAEILQLLMLKPSLAILDETDSGLDVDAVRTVSKGVEEYKKSVGGALIVITHSTRILEALDIDQTHVLVSGNIVAEGDGSIVDDINENGFEKYINQ